MRETFKAGKLAQMGLLSAEDGARAADLVAHVQSDGIETVRVLFVDQHGILRGKTIVASAFASVFSAGIAVPSTLLLKDTSHRTAFDVWSHNSGIQAGPMQGANDVLLVPCPETFRVLPWSPHSAWIFCDVVFRDGRSIPFSARHVLRRAMDRLADQNMAAVIGLEVEFHIFERTDTATNHSQSEMPGAPVETRNLAQGYQFLTENRYGELEGILDVLRRYAQGLGLAVRSVEIEMGPSQVEFTFDPADPMTQADALVMFRTMVKQVCAAKGLHASFMAKPRLENTMANGWHIHQSLLDVNSGRNLFMPDEGGGLTPQASGWIAGLLTHAAAASVLIAPSVNSYKRYLPFQLAPNKIQWGEDNRGAMLRALLQEGDGASRIENRAPDTSANPYYALAAQLIAGGEGISNGRVAPAPTQSPYEGEGEQLPRSLGDALQAFEASSLFRRALGSDFSDYLLHLKRFEWNRYLNTVSEWEQTEYFNLY
ncbi:glutamine synthetase family protein [Parasedimentitalea maritima]|uniref:Glutamine synthetase n=1 Tax=Parasedimentitalea maritima TaxID=2578117 RepID=A0A6A4RGN6_9RHOB|nr:glutamine synthetase family protein [Zongyanglinia marina]KAE9630547.1 glutamine synthetase [Zongyanglinia marina]